MTPVFSSVFSALSGAVLRFACCVTLWDPCSGLVENFQQPIRIHQKNIFTVQLREQNGVHHLKKTKNWTEKCCQIVCSILFVLFYCMTRAFSCSGLTWAQIQSEAKSSAPAADPLPDPPPPFLALPSLSLGMEYCMTARQVGWVESPLNRSTPWKETPEKRHQSEQG